ncbi:hypothetical protein [Kribbella catacumbae]|uniref:hypothetical protein n=1 Tax=Kribbella catacumbae TaxID=460086 RepID=UPI00036E97AE|nr:hypothetical protein [Kribbella catacumbae]
MTDESDSGVESRLRAADPVPADRPVLPDARLHELLETVMNTTSNSTPNNRHRPVRTAWLTAAAVLVVIVAPASVYLLAGRGTDDAQANTPSQPATAQSTPTPAKTTMKLAPPAADAQQSCPVFSVDVLKVMPTAFSGTVAKVGGGVVTLDVDHWYRGGNADQVLLSTPDPSATVALRGGAVSFALGDRYLISAAGGVVNDCDLSGTWSTSLELAFKQAFSG